MFTFDHQKLRLMRAQQSRQTLTSSRTRVQSELNFRNTNCGGVSHNAKVTGKRQLCSPSEGNPIDGCNNRFRKLFNHGLNLHPASHSEMIFGCEIAHHLEICTSDKVSTGALDNDAAHR